MKKLLAVSIIASLASASAFATVNTEVSQESNGEASFKGGYTLDNGISFGAEYVHDFTRTELPLIIDNSKDNESRKEISVNAAWKIALDDNLWVQPLAEITIPGKKNTEDLISKVKNGNTYKLGMKAGYEFDFGLYTAAQYRFDFSEDKVETILSTHNETHKNQTHRTDLTVGYRIDVVDVSANWIHKNGHTQIKNTATKPKAKSNELELKATYNQYDNVKPYIQYTVKGDVDVKNAPNQALDGKYKQDNVFKVGVALSF